MEDFHVLVSPKPSDVTESYSSIAYISVRGSIRFIARVCSPSARLDNRRHVARRPWESHSGDMPAELPVPFHCQLPGAQH